MYRVSHSSQKDAQPMTVCSAEIRFQFGSVVTADDQAQTCGLVTFSDSLTKELFTTDTVKGTEGVDFVSLQLFSAHREDLYKCGWHESAQIGGLCFFSPKGTVAVKNTGSEWTTGLVTADVVGFEALWKSVGVVYMPIATTPDEVACTTEHPLYLDPHIRLTREVLDRAVNGAHGPAAVLAELLSRFLLHARSIAHAHALPEPLRYFVHALLGGMEDTSSDPSEIDQVQAARRALLAHGIHMHLGGRGYDRTAFTKRCGFPFLVYQSMSGPTTALFSIPVTKDFERFVDTKGCVFPTMYAYSPPSTPPSFVFE